MEQKILLRLCHVCGVLNESENEVLKCDGCGKGFLPLNYFEKIRERALQAVSGGKENPSPTLHLNPLNGLIVFW